MAKFKVGDTVQLKSGGPVMTIYKLPDPEGTNEVSKTHYQCEWFKEDTLQYGNFLEDTLIAIEAKKEKSKKGK